MAIWAKKIGGKFVLKWPKFGGKSKKLAGRISPASPVFSMYGYSTHGTPGTPGTRGTRAYIRKTSDAGDISSPIFWIFRQI